MIGPYPDLRPHIAEITCALLGAPNRRLSTRAQLRFGTNGSIAVELTGEKRGQWFDHEANIGGGPWSLLTIKGRMTIADAIGWLRSQFGINLNLSGKRMRDPVATYDYLDARGDLLFQVCRFEPKDFRQRRPDGRGGWIWKVKGTRHVPYRLPELIAAPADCTVFIAEGEKDVDRLARLKVVATCNPGGAAKPRVDGKPSKSKWRPELNPFFRDRDVVILPDNDDAGRDHARTVASNLAPIAARVRILGLSGLPAKGDVSDWLDAGGTRETLERLAADAPIFSPQDGAKPTADQRDTPRDNLDDEAEIVRLAALSPIACDRELPAAAERLGCRVPTLRGAVAAARGNGSATAGQGRPLDLPEPEPWPDPVDGAALIEETVTAIRQYVIFTEAQALATAFWAIFTHAFDAFDFSPRLAITSAEKRSGKTRLVEVLERIVDKPLLVSGITGAALLRVIEQCAPCMLLDEIDTMMKGDAELREVLRGLINSGFDRAGARFVKNVPIPGGGYEPQAFSTWCPMLLAGIGKLPGTVADRAIPIELERKPSAQKVKPLRAGDGNELRDIGRKAARWVADNLNALRDARPESPAQLHDRAADTWSPLFAIADVAGGIWPERVRAAAIALAGDDEDTMSDGVLLLADLRELFAKEPSGMLFTREILKALHADETRPWPEWKNGRPITDRQLASLLRPYKIKPKTVRRGTETDKGYRVEWFADAFASYLPPLQSVTPSQSNIPAAFEADRSVTPPVATTPNVTDHQAENLSVSATCDGVTDRNPLWWRDGADEWPSHDPEEAVWTE